MSNSKARQGFRQANFDDVPAIARMLREFYAKAGGIYGIEYDHLSALHLIDRVIRRGVCILGGNSCAGAVMERFPFNESAIIAHVIFWYFKGPSGMRIYRALAEECRDAGATHLNPTSHFPDNRIGRFYESHGQTPTEIQYLAPIEKCCNGAQKE